MDQLSELAGANPEAAAIVGALLKGHMGHIHHHEQSGAEIFRSMMTPPHLALATPGYHPHVASYETSYRAPVANAQYDPNSASKRDESAVSRLLNAVASMGGKKGKKIQALLNKHERKAQVENPLMEDQAMFEEAPTAAPMSAQDIAAAAEVPPEPATPAPKHENSYLKGIDLSGDMPVETGKHHPHKEYLKGLDVSGGSADSLASFSFGDDAPAAPVPVVKKVEPPKPKKPNAFLKFLGYTDKAPAPVEKAAPAPEHKAKTNSYLDAVKFFG